MLIDCSKFSVLFLVVAEYADDVFVMFVLNFMSRVQESAGLSLGQIYFIPAKELKLW